MFHSKNSEALAGECKKREVAMRHVIHHLPLQFISSEIDISRTDHKSFLHLSASATEQQPTFSAMMLKTSLALLLLSTSNGAGTDKTSYLRKLKKDWSYWAKNTKDQGDIYTEMMNSIISDVIDIPTDLPAYSVPSESDYFHEHDVVYPGVVNSTINGPLGLANDAVPSETDDFDGTEDIEDEIVPIDVDPSLAKALVRQTIDLPTNQPTNPIASLESDDIISDIEEEAWNHGATAVSARRTGTITFKIPDNTAVGDTLFLFLRCVIHNYLE
jgi:hypothetical protein